jgi:hypothetical protein
MKRLATVVVLLVCLVCITAATLDIHCGAVQPAGDTYRARVPSWEDAVKQKQQQKPDSECGARVLKRALEIMKQGHYGWSWALAKAEKEVTQ